MDVNVLTELLGDRPLTKLTPEARQLAELIRKELQIEFDINAHTGNSILLLLNGVEFNTRMRILNTNLNDGMDIIEYQRSKLSDYEERSKGSRRLQAVLSFGCGTLLAVIIATLCWCLFNDKTLPSWEVLLIILSIPGLIVLNANGVLSAENKQLMQATLGQVPMPGVLGMVVGAMTKQRRQDDRLPQQPFQQYNQFPPEQTNYGASVMRPYPPDTSTTGNYNSNDLRPPVMQPLDGER